jgi:hypothetical protein
VVFEALMHPDRDPNRAWLRLQGDEVAPRVLEAQTPTRVVWSSLWPVFASVLIRFDLDFAGAETGLRWTLFADDPVISPADVRRLRSRINRLINADLRYSFSQ